jgi:hypothetical protein
MRTARRVRRLRNVILPQSAVSVREVRSGKNWFGDTAQTIAALLSRRAFEFGKRKWSCVMRWPTGALQQIPTLIIGRDAALRSIQARRCGYLDKETRSSPTELTRAEAGL